MRITLKTLKAGWGPIGGEFQVSAADRQILNPLFVVLRDRRALLEPVWGRGPTLSYVVTSIVTIRDELTKTLQALGPDSEAQSWLEDLRAACREFLTQVESHEDELSRTDVLPALEQLRSAFLTAANHAAAFYRLPAARALADEMAANPD